MTKLQEWTYIKKVVIKVQDAAMHFQRVGHLVKLEFIYLEIFMIHIISNIKNIPPWYQS